LHVSIEYMFLGLFIVIALGISFSNMAMVSILPSREIVQSQLKVKAESLIDFILLCPGDPPNWNGDISPKIFGLALANTSQPYVLDIGKVYALNNVDLQENLSDLLGVKDEYGFYFKIEPLFKISIDESSPGMFIINVTSFKGIPLPNVDVTGYYGNLNERATVRENTTDFSGMTQLDFTDVSGSVLVVYASLSGIQVSAVYPPRSNYTVEAGSIVETQYPPLNEPIVIVYRGILEGKDLKPMSASAVTIYRYVKIEGCTYYVTFTMWRLVD